MRSTGANTAKQASQGRQARDVLNMRIHADVRNLIDRAAELEGKTRTDFVLGAARAAAMNAVLDHALLSLPQASYGAFAKLLDSPPKPNARLSKSLRTTAPWD